MQESQEDSSTLRHSFCLVEIRKVRGTSGDAALLVTQARETGVCLVLTSCLKVVFKVCPSLFWKCASSLSCLSTVEFAKNC